MNISTRFDLGDRVRIVRPTKYGENAEGLTGCVVRGLMFSAWGEATAESYTLRCLVPADAMSGAGETSRMLYGISASCLEAE